jgi:hypothetical protein
MLRPNKSIAQNTVPRSKNDRPVLILKDTERRLCLQMEVLVGQPLEKIQKGYSRMIIDNTRGTISRVNPDKDALLPSSNR